MRSITGVRLSFTKRDHHGARIRSDLAGLCAAFREIQGPVDVSPVPPGRAPDEPAWDHRTGRLFRPSLRADEANQGDEGRRTGCRRAGGDGPNERGDSVYRQHPRPDVPGTRRDSGNGTTAAIAGGGAANRFERGDGAPPTRLLRQLPEAFFCRGGKRLRAVSIPHAADSWGRAAKPTPGLGKWSRLGVPGIGDLESLDVQLPD